MTAKKAEAVSANRSARKRGGKKRKAIAPGPTLTDAEAEVLFIIWKVNRPITNAEIADEHSKYFGSGRGKKEATIRGRISRIKKKEVLYGRSYISSEDRRRAHQIAKDPLLTPKATIHSQATAVMLLELKTGYLKRQNPAAEILRESFEHYISEKYCSPEINLADRLFKDPGDVSDRMVKAEANDYLKFVKYGKTVGVEAAPRLDHDLKYILLIVEDYLKEIEGQPPSPRLVEDLEALLSLFGPDHLHAPAPSAKGAH